MRDEVIKKLISLQDTKYRDFHSKLCPGLENIIGVRTPELRKLAKEIARGDYQKFLAECKNQYYEETLLEGLVIAAAKVTLDERLRLLKRFVPKINNWATCDMVCGSFKFQPNELTKVWDLVLQYETSTREYERRFMIVMMMDYFLVPEYLPKIFTILDKIKTDQYYVNMASAWLIATALAKHREKTLRFLKCNNLDAWVQNKAIQKARESYRVSKEDKELLLTLKK